MRRSLVLPVLALAAVGLAACTSGNSGSPTAAPTTTATTSDGAGNALASIDPCSLLSQQDMTQLHLTSTGPDNDSQSKGCKWNSNGSYSMAVFIYPHLGIKPVGAGVTAVKLQSHDAVQTSSGFGCDLEIAITKSSSTDIEVSSTGSGAQECQIAQQYATIIEPKLPAQQK